MDGPFGEGTYELDISGVSGRDFLLELEVAGAAEAYVDGVLVETLGSMGDGSAVSVEERWGPVELPLRTAGDTATVRLIIANHAVRVGGVTDSVLGDGSQMARRSARRLVMDAINVSVLGTFGMVFLVIGFRKRDDLSYPLFALLCLALAARDFVGGTGDMTNLLLPQLGWDARIRIDYLTLPLGVIFGYNTATQLTGFARKHWSTLAITVVAAVLALATVAVPVPTLRFVLPASQGLMLLAGLLVGCFLVVAAVRGDRRSLQFLTAFMLFVLAMVHDVLISLGAFTSGVRLGTLGFIAVMAVFALLLIGDFVSSFLLNRQLAVDLQQTNADLEKTHRSVLRFVPDAFLQLLGKRNVVEVQRGDHTQEELEILFCDLRGFTTLIEVLGPDRAFPFINRYLRHMEPPITNNGGFISQYLGDCIMALFTSGADDAVLAAIEMSRALERFNEAEPEGPVRFGIGLASGPLMLGTIGGDERLDGGVIGDSVNHASRLEGMTKLYGTTLLIDESTRDRLQRPEALILREVDRVVAKGRTQPSRIYEVLDALPADQRRARSAGLEGWRAALAAYQRGDLGEARAGFARCAELDPTDRAAQVLQERCDHYARVGLPDGWDGTTHLEHK